MATPASSATNTRILLIQLRRMGDVLVTTPAVRLLREQRPGARIDFLTDAAGEAMLRGNPDIDDVIMWSKGWKRNLRLMRRLRNTHYDAVVDWSSNRFSALHTRATGARVRIGLRTGLLHNAAYTVRLLRDTSPRYVPLHKIYMLGPLGIDMPADPDVSLRISVTDTERAAAVSFLQKLGVGGSDRFVALTPTSKRGYKRWPADRWAQVADALTEAGARVLITHGPGEREQALAVVERVKHPVLWNPEGTPLRLLVAVLERCDFWVGNDGGSKHIAAAVGKPTIAVHRYGNASTWTDMRPGSNQVAVEPTGETDARGETPSLDQLPVDAVSEPALALYRSLSLPVHTRGVSDTGRSMK